jgi:hypothetical protein
LPVSPTVGNAKMTPEYRSDIREIVWEMSRTTNKILISGIILVLVILALLIYYGMITIPL